MKRHIIFNFCAALFLFQFGTLSSSHVYKSYQTTIHCNSIEPIHYPKSIKDAQALVVSAKKRGLKVKAIGSRHSITDIICTDGIAISLAEINDQKMIINSNEGTATFGAELKLREILIFLEKNGQSLIHVPLYDGITIGGAIGTQAQGSSLVHPNSISDQITSLKIIDGSGDLKTISDPESLAAFKLHLGLLGIIVEVTVKTVPLFKIQMENKVEPETTLFDGTVLKWARSHDHFQLWWFPNVKEIVTAKGNYLKDISTPGNAKANVMMDVDPLIARITNITCEYLHLLRFTKALIALEGSTKEWLVSKKPKIPAIYEEDGELKNPAVGYGWRLMASTCSDKCWWNNPWSFVNTVEAATSFDIKNFNAVLGMVKKVLAKYPTSFHMFGILIRFSLPSDSLLGLGYGRKESFTIEWVLPQRIDKYEGTLDGAATFQLLQQEMVNYGGKFHWGKNGLYYFTQEVFKKSLGSDQRKKFIEMMKKYDPDQLFLNKFGARLLGQGDEMDKDPLVTRCALSGYCICKENRDCGEWQICETTENGFNICIDKYEQYEVFGVLALLIFVLIYSLRFLFFSR